MRKEEVIAEVQRLTTGLGHLANSLEEQDVTGLWVYGDLIQSNAEKLLNASKDLNTYATGSHQLHQAVQNAKEGGQL